LAIAQSNGALEWRFVAVAMDKKLALPISVLSQDFEKFDGVDSFQLSHARN
jgi:putative Mg2+ transporter-C (MgtC) family protein